ncbi:hypothetical protein D3C78_1913820 [compost metagenome]
MCAITLPVQVYILDLSSITTYRVAVIRNESKSRKEVDMALAEAVATGALVLIGVILTVLLMQYLVSAQE